MTRILQRQNGFLMVEVVLAVLIISVALVAALGMFITSTQANADAAEYTVATTLAQKQLELLKTKDAQNYWAKLELTAPAKIDWQDTEVAYPPLLNGVNYQVDTTASLSPENQNLVQVTVTVTWDKPNGRPNSIVQLTTFFSKVTLQN